MSTLYESYNDTFDKIPVKIYKHDLSGKYIWAPLHWHRSIELLVSFEGHNCISIGRNDFVDGKAKLLYLPARQLGV